MQTAQQRASKFDPAKQSAEVLLQAVLREASDHLLEVIAATSIPEDATPADIKATFSDRISGALRTAAGD